MTGMILKCLMVLCFLFFWNETVKFHFLQEEEANLVIYRKSKLNFSTGFQLNINEANVINGVESNTYYVIKVNPGKVLLTTQGSAFRNFTEKKEYSLTLEAGKTYYLEALQEYQMMMTSLHLVRRQEDVAEQAIKKMKGKLQYLTVSEMDKQDF